MIYRNKESEREINVISMHGFGVEFHTLDNNGEITGTGTMGKYILDTEYELVDSDK